jgi:hypothetical protein
MYMSPRRRASSSSKMIWRRRDDLEVMRESIPTRSATAPSTRSPIWKASWIRSAATGTGDQPRRLTAEDVAEVAVCGRESQARNRGRVIRAPAGAGRRATKRIVGQHEAIEAIIKACAALAPG